MRPQLGTNSSATLPSLPSISSCTQQVAGPFGLACSAVLETKFGAVRVTVGNAAPQWTKAEAGLEQAQGRGQ